MASQPVTCCSCKAPFTSSEFAGRVHVLAWPPDVAQAAGKYDCLRLRSKTAKMRRSDGQAAALHVHVSDTFAFHRGAARCPQVRYMGPAERERFEVSI